MFRSFSRVSPDLPILLLSGSEDPVGEHGKGIKKVFALLKEKGANVHMKLYEGYRHEILQDFCKEDVINDILVFVG